MIFLIFITIFMIILIIKNICYNNHKYKIYFSNDPDTIIKNILLE
jgi:hypothetical protein